MAPSIALAGLQDTGGYLLQQWTGAMGDYTRERNRLAAWFNNAASPAYQNPALNQQARALLPTMNRFQVAIDKVGQLLQQGVGSWNDVKAALSALPAVWGLAGADDRNLGAVPLVLGLGATAVLAAALSTARYLVARLTRLNDAAGVMQQKVAAFQATQGRAPTAAELATISTTVAVPSSGLVLFGVDIPWWAIGAGALVLWFTLRPGRA